MKLFVVLLITLALLCQLAQATIIGIDLASDSLKVALIRPGHPIEIVTNFQSKRKTPTAIAFFKGERSFGSDATALSGRKPEASISKLQRMLGHTLEHPMVQEILSKQYFPYRAARNETTGLMTIDVDGENAYAAEELLAMILEHVKDMTFAFGEQTVKDCVITVPTFFTQLEREAVLTAAQIARLNVLGLIEENTAAALHYGMDHVFDTPRNVLYYNLGAGSLEVSVVHHSSYTAKEGGKERKVGQVKVLGKAYDASVGGFFFDLALTELFADKFNAAWAKKKGAKAGDVRQFARPMVRLKNEATKIKEVLSANTEFPLRVEALHADVDLTHKMTRKEFEEIAEPLFARLLAPVELALQQANLSVTELYAVELLGGSVRMPRVKRMLEDFFAPAAVPEKEGDSVKKSIVGQHLNGDEATALGAAFHAANLSTSFKVRKVGLVDTQLFAVHLQLSGLEANAQQGEEQAKFEKSAMLFPAKSFLPSKTKTVAFTHTEDIVCRLTYDQSASLVDLPQGTPSLLAEYNITGIAAFTREAREQGIAAAPKVHLSFVLDHSGISKLVKAEVSVEIPEKEEEKEAQSTDGEAASSPAEEKKEEPAKGTEDNKKEKESAAKDKKASKPKELRRALSVSFSHGAAVPQWTPFLVAEAQARLRALYAQDEARRARAKAMNDLETVLYKIKNRLADEEDALSAVSTAAQRESVVSFANELEEWLYDEGRDQEVPVYLDRQRELQAMAEEIFHRHRELGARKQAVENARKVLADVQKSVDVWESEETMPQVSAEECAALREKVAETQRWIEESVEAQAKHSPSEKPLWESKEVYERVNKVQAVYTKLLEKPHPIVHAKHNEPETVKVELNANEMHAETKTEAETEGESVKAEKEQQQENKEKKADEL